MTTWASGTGAPAQPPPNPWFQPNGAPTAAPAAPALDPTYGNALKSLVTDPNSFKGTPGYQFQLDQGLESVNRAAPGGRGSGNALAALVKYGTGLASQDYGNEVDRLGRLAGQEEQYNIGQGGVANAAQANVNTAKRDANDLGLGLYTAGNNLALGEGQNATNQQRNWFDYDLGKGNLARGVASDENNFNVANGRNAVDWFNANTNRGSAVSADYWRNPVNANRRPPATFV